MNRETFQGIPYCKQPWAGDPAARPKWNCETNCCLSPNGASPANGPSLRLEAIKQPLHTPDTKRAGE